MPTITIDGRECEFEQGQTILQIANANGIEIPQYCYHDGLSDRRRSAASASARCWAPNAAKRGQARALHGRQAAPDLRRRQAVDGHGRAHRPRRKAVANQKAVMEYLLINHPLDCPVCDQAGECDLAGLLLPVRSRRLPLRGDQGQAAQEEPRARTCYLYADRCIMCTRCVRFAREVSGTSELLVEGRGNQEQIDVFPGDSRSTTSSAPTSSTSAPSAPCSTRTFCSPSASGSSSRTPSASTA